MAGRIERIVDPCQWPCAGVSVDRIELPMPVDRPAGASPALEAQERQTSGQAEQVRQVLLGLLLPAATPDQVEVLGEAQQLCGCHRGEKVRDAVDRTEDPIWTAVWIDPGPGPAAEQRDHAVDVDHQQRPVSPWTGGCAIAQRFFSSHTGWPR